MNREILFFALGASVAASILVLAFFELLFTVRRRKANEALQQKIRAMRTFYNESINSLVVTGDTALNQTEEQLTTTKETIEEQKQTLTSEYEKKLADATAAIEKELKNAKAKAKKLQEEAHLEAEEYLITRKKEIEEDLMNLVISVTKKVLPAGISYQSDKELVLQALRDVKAENIEEEVAVKK